MALVLGVDAGDTFFVGRRQLHVLSIISPARITVKRDDGQMFTVRRDAATEVFPDVFIYTGPWQRASRARLVFDAPQTILIRRGRRRLIPCN